MIIKKYIIFSQVLFLLFINLSLQAQEKRMSFNVNSFKLKNGLQVFLSEDNSLPLISVVIAYKVGSLYEKPGKTGLAYMLENLMFYGSNNVGRMQHISFIQKVGGQLNAETREDKTIFYQTVPSNQLPLVLWLESDRMKSLTINASNVRKAKNSLIEEIHHRSANNHYLESSQYFYQLIYNDFAYSHPVIGKEEDIANITIEDVNNFYHTYYTPNNAVLCIVGNFEGRKIQNIIRKYFETIPRGETPPPLVLPKVSETKGTVKTLNNYLASLPGFYLGFRIASPYEDDYYTLSIIEYILLRGKSSRLYKKLFKKERIAFQFNGGIEKRNDRAIFKIFVTNSNKITMQQSQKAIFSEITNLKSNLISKKELLKSKNIFKMDYINQYDQSIESKAIFISETFLSQNTLDNLPNELERYLSVTISDVIGIMNRYFTDEKILLNINIR